MSKRYFLISMLALTIGCTEGLGGGGSNKLLQQFPSPDSMLKAVLFERSGGATVGDSYRISIISSSDTLDQNDLGNTFVFDDNHGEAGMFVDSVSLMWVSKDTIQIGYSEKLRTFGQEKKVGGVVVRYRAF